MLRNLSLSETAPFCAQITHAEYHVILPLGPGFRTPVYTEGASVEAIKTYVALKRFVFSCVSTNPGAC